MFSDVQRKALEKMFQKQKYISKPDRKKLASKLGLKDSQVTCSGILGTLEKSVRNLRVKAPLRTDRIPPTLTHPLSSGLQVKIWFQNRRMKWRNSKERELLSSGGCREQTLPTKANPHPDLSDVGKKSSADEEEDEEEAFGRENLRAAGSSVSSPSLSSKHSDFSESDEEEITVS